MNSGDSARMPWLKVAWLSILLGIAMEIILLAAAVGFGNMPAVRPVVADLVQKISWSFFVCVGLAFGAAASKMNAPVMGLTGFVSAPVAFAFAKGLHKGVLEALSVAAATPVHPSAFTSAAIKAVEYACLGALVGWLGRQSWGGGKAHAGAGFFLGVIFGTLVLYLTVQGAPKPPAMTALVSKAINEMLFPVGCSLILFSASAISRRKV